MSSGRAWKQDGPKGAWHKLSSKQAFRFYLRVNRLTGERAWWADYRVEDLVSLRHYLAPFAPGGAGAAGRRANLTVLELSRAELAEFTDAQADEVYERALRRRRPEEAEGRARMETQRQEARGMDVVYVHEEEWERLGRTGARPSIQAGWAVYNAPRPLPGEVSWELWLPSQRGIHYAAGPPAAPLGLYGRTLEEDAQALGAARVEIVGDADVLRLLEERLAEDGYSLAEYEAAGQGPGDVARAHGLPWAGGEERRTE
jgi:hypothetical protein